MTRVIRSAVLIYGGWTLAALFFTSQYALICITRGFEFSMSDQVEKMLSENGMQREDLQKLV